MHLTTTRSVIKALGGLGAVAKLTGRQYSAAGNWAQKATFPANTYFVLQSELNARGHTAPPTLWNMEVATSV